MLTFKNEANSNMFRIDCETPITEGTQSTASFYHPLDSPKEVLLTPSKLNSEPLYIKPTQNLAQVRQESIDSHIRDLILNPGKKVVQQLPRLNTQRGEVEKNSHYRQYMLSQKRQNPEILRSYMKNYKSNTRPNSRELSGMLSHRDRIQQDSIMAADSYRTEKIISIDDSNKWEKSIRKESQNIEGLVKTQSVPLLKVKGLKQDKKQTQRIRLQKQIANIEESTQAPPNTKLRRSKTTGEHSRERKFAEEVSAENHNISTERTAHGYSSPYILEDNKLSYFENKVSSRGLKNPMPYWLNSNPVKSQEEIQENLRKAGFRRSLAIINPGTKIINNSHFPLDILLLDRNRIPLHQNSNNLNNQSVISGREEKYKQQTTSMEIILAGMLPAEGFAAKYVSNEAKKLQRTLSDVKNKNIIHVEESSPSPDRDEGRSFSAAKLRPKFRSEEAILNKLFNRNSNKK